ncbi:MAG: hypothetical protein M1423_00455 [Acidobacteria bacterium]|nr:hypothetical protein [Acidobacteriota bacterium]
MRNVITIYGALRGLATLGNAIYFLWFFYHGIDSGFVGAGVEVAAWIGLFALLIFNVILFGTIADALESIGLMANGIGLIEVLYSGIAFGFGGSLIQFVSHFGILLLLLLNIGLLIFKRTSTAQSSLGEERP